MGRLHELGHRRDIRDRGTVATSFELRPHLVLDPHRRCAFDASDRGAIGADTDVARLGRSGALPAHEQTAVEDVDVADWARVAATPEFTALVAAKRRFIVPATLFFVVYYFALPVLVGYFPEIMDRRIAGGPNIAYLFALSQFFMAWVLAALYLRAASGFDERARRIREALRGQRGPA